MALQISGSMEVEVWRLGWVGVLSSLKTPEEVLLNQQLSGFGLWGSPSRVPS